MIESMFEELVVELSGVDDAAVNLAISGWGAAEAVTAALKMTAVTELIDRRVGDDLAEAREMWDCDAWDCAVAEVAADLCLGRRAANTLMRQALALRDRLPRVGALLARGLIPLRVANTATWRTVLIVDEALLAEVDAELAEAARSYGKLSEQKLQDKIDTIVHRHDPDAVRRFRTVEKSLNVAFGAVDDDTGTQSIWGRMTEIDAALLDRSVTSLASQPCRDDPRTVGERRTAALAVLAVRGDRLPCMCGKADCPAAGRDPRADHIVVHVITDADPTAADPADSGPNPTVTDPTDNDSIDGSDGDRPQDPPSDPQPCPPTSVVAGGGVIPAPLLARLFAMRVAIRHLATGTNLAVEPGYRPSAALARFVRARDVTCTFPGCEHPAEKCDVDHTIPYGNGGLTHPGNLKCLCRKHHLLKTFWVGRGGWTDHQAPDGTITWTSPSGLRHRVPPASRLYFPDWDTTTPVPDVAAAPPCNAGAGRGLAMPTRRVTRARQYARMIHTERERNRRIAEQNPAPF